MKLQPLNKSVILKLIDEEKEVKSLGGIYIPKGDSYHAPNIQKGIIQAVSKDASDFLVKDMKVLFVRAQATDVPNTEDLVVTKEEYLVAIVED